MFLQKLLKGSLILFTVFGFHFAHAQQCGSLTPRTLSYVCNRINNAATTTSCFQAGKDAYLDSCALAACDRFNDANETVSCVSSIRNRTYTGEEVLACDRIQNTSETSRCLSAAGRTVLGGHFGGRERSYVTQQIESALLELQSNQLNALQARLKLLKEYLNN